MEKHNFVMRTNYFHVKDANAFKEFMNRVYGENEIHIFKKDDMYGFGCYGGISGVMNSENKENDECEPSYNEFINGLQKHVSDNDAIIIMQIAHKELIYVIGGIYVVTSINIKFMDTTSMAIDIARELLNNENYSTQFAD